MSHACELSAEAQSMAMARPDLRIMFILVLLVMGPLSPALL
jgi:hypothetical protein